MTYLSVHHSKVSPLQKSNTTLTIDVQDVFPESFNMVANKDVFVEDGRRLAEQLYLHLPGGTLDQLVICLLQRKASDFVASFEGAFGHAQTK